MGRLIQTTTTDGLNLQGYYVPSLDKKVITLYIHGMEGNFYESNALILADELERENSGFLTVNTRGHDSGSRYELLEEAHLDISAWLEFLINEGYQEIVLQGHSAGTIKVVRYLFEGELKNHVNKIILLSPIDPLGYRTAKGRVDIDGFLAKAQIKVDEGKGDELITSEFDHDLISYKTFISWYKQDDLGRMFDFFNADYDFPILKKITIPTKIIVGSMDEYFYPSNPNHPEAAMALLLKYIPKAEGVIINGANHSYNFHQTEMAKEVIKFIK